MNTPLAAGDLVLAAIAPPTTGSAAVVSPLAGQTMSCRVCHLSGEFKNRAGLAAHGVRLFNDFATRSPVPERGDGRHTTPRNAPPLVGLSAAPPGGATLLHYDGEFATMEDLILATYTGRNFGWLPAERAEARRHFARVIREDDGSGTLAGEYAHLSYAIVLRGVDPAVPAALRLPASFRFDPSKESDEEVLRGCAQLVAAYLNTLQFSRDADGRYNGSPYDAFLAANRLPAAPQTGETAPEYTRRLRETVAALRVPRYIDDPTRKLALHDQPFRFGEQELRGLRIFLRGAVGSAQKGGAGNCAECHVPPHFTDFTFHNTGVAQDEYDALHGAGTFHQLAVPDLATRSADFDRWLQPTPPHSRAKGVFLSPAAANALGRTDLGLWNVYGNSDLPAPQPAIERLLNRDGRLEPDEVLTQAFGRFKTPGIRDLGQSAPYFHTGGMGKIEEVPLFYQRMSTLAHQGKMRNAPPEYFNMRLEAADIEPLAAFLRALNEDYTGPCDPASQANQSTVKTSVPIIEKSSLGSFSATNAPQSEQSSPTSN